MVDKTPVRRRGLNREDGYSLPELLMVCVLIAIMGGMAAGVTLNYVNQSKSDGAVTSFISVLELTRNRAISERRNFEVTFTLPNRLIVQRVNVANGAVTDRTTVTDVRLDNTLVYKKFTGLPDTPDMFGAGAPIDFDGTGPIAFTSDGSLVDQAGDPSNATIFVGQNNNDSSTARAITIMGATGLIKKFTWGKTQWVG